MLYTVEARATNVEPRDELLEELYEWLRAEPNIEGPAVSADTVDHVVHVRADVEAPTRVEADHILVTKLVYALERLVAGTRITYVLPALAGE